MPSPPVQTVVTHSALPTSGQLIGVFLQAFGGPRGLPSEVVAMLRDKTSQRVFKGRFSRNWCCRLTALQFMLFVRELVPLPELKIGEKDWSIDGFSLMTWTELILWDELARDRRRRRAYLRYFAVDATTRLFVLFDERVCRSGLLDAHPAWAERARRGDPLRGLLDAVVPARTNAEHAHALGFTPSELSGWKTGSQRPSVEAIEWLAKYLGKQDPRGVAFVRRLLHWHYALSAIASAVADVEGEAFAKEWAGVFTRSVACRAGKDVPESLTARLFVTPLWRFPPEVREALLAHACEHGADDEWRRDVREVWAEFEALPEPDEIVIRHARRHAHPFWRVPELAKHRSGRLAVRSRAKLLVRKPAPSPAAKQKK